MGEAREVDVIVIGGGMSGLAAADTLQMVNEMNRKANPQAPQISYVVLEGSARPGGRTYTQHPELGYLDMGGEFLGVRGTQTYSWGMVERFGIEMFDTYLPANKRSVYEDRDGKLTEYMKSYPITPDIIQTVGTLEALVLTLKAHLGRPWEAMNARQWDGISVWEWIEQQTQDVYTRDLMAIAIRSAFSVEPQNCSFLYLLHYAATCGSFEAFENVRGGGDSVRFRYGTQQLADNLVKAVGPDNVLFNRKVDTISQDASGAKVTVTTEDGGQEVWSGQFVIVGLSPVVSARLNYEPALPPARLAVSRGAPMAHTIKGFTVFRSTWWRQNHTGYVLSAKGPADWIMDNTWLAPADPKVPDSPPTFEHASLMTFIVGERAKEWSQKSEQERGEAVLEQFGHVFESPELARSEFVKYVDYDWDNDPWSGGCPAGCFVPGVLTGTASDGQPLGPALTAPVGRIHWAGSETATDWMGGYMNGALQSGIRAAGEVVNIIAESQEG